MTMVKPGLSSIICKSFCEKVYIGEEVQLSDVWKNWN